MYKPKKKCDCQNINQAIGKLEYTYMLRSKQYLIEDTIKW